VLPLLALAASAPEGPPPLAAALPPGSPHESVVKLLLKPYAEATGTVLGQPVWDGSQDGLKKLAAGHGFDLALLDGPLLAALCRAQLVQKLDWGALGRDRFVAGAASDCGAGAYLATTVLAWDRDKLQGTPDWADFWDVTRHPGRRGLHRGARGNLEIALMADGVAPADVYRVLRSAEGVDRAFRKLDQLKPYILWWDQPAQPAQMLASAKVLMTSAPVSFLPEPQGTSPAHVGVQWAGSLGEVEAWAVPKDAPHPEAALMAIGLAADPARQAEFARATRLGPATKPGLSLLPEAVRAHSPSLPANLGAGLAIDEGFWLDAGEKLDARFSAWIGK
jgi:putative spermidine/putrescine transport system substrate-binding protein